jgi:AAA+ superfamily predicted ATPase
MLATGLLIHLHTVNSDFFIKRAAPKVDPHFISHTLAEPPSAATYRVSESFARLNEGSYTLRTEDGRFNLRAYATEGLCEMTPKAEVFAHVNAQYDSDDGVVSYRNIDGWYDISWQGHAFSVLTVTLPAGIYTSQYSWIAGHDRETVEKLLIEVIEWNMETHGDVLVFADEMWQKDRHLAESIKSSTLDNLILTSGLKEELHADLKRFFASETVFKQYGVPWRRGILLLGPPGNGKTHAIKALINAFDKPCLYVKTTSGDRPSSSQVAIRSIFERARATAPCILVLEDLDSLVTDDNRSVFLNELDGFTDNSGILTIATTNHAEKLDVAIIDRPSRFDRKYHFDLPGAVEREAYLAYWNRTVQGDLRLSAEGLREIAALTDGFSFAYLKELMMSSIMAWISQAEHGSMDRLMREQVGLLRAQMTTTTDKKPEPEAAPAA